jgi:hypothetical protein
VPGRHRRSRRGTNQPKIVTSPPLGNQLNGRQAPAAIRRIGSKRLEAWIRNHDVLSKVNGRVVVRSDAHSGPGKTPVR